MKEPDDQRSSVAVAMEWATRVTSISLMMVVPGLVGLWLDGHFKTVVVFTIVGFAFGFAGGMYSLLKLVKSRESKQKPDDHERSSK